jgi:hypothetical protein
MPAEVDPRAHQIMSILTLEPETRQFGAVCSKDLCHHPSCSPPDNFAEDRLLGKDVWKSDERTFSPAASIHCQLICDELRSLSLERTFALRQFGIAPSQESPNPVQKSSQQIVGVVVMNVFSTMLVVDGCHVAAAERWRSQTLIQHFLRR